MPIAKSHMLPPRYPEIDLARFLAMAMMAVYHLAFDLEYFYGWDIDLDRAGWVILQKATLHLFLLLVGVSGVLSRKFAKRALVILFWAMMITLVTYVMDPRSFIRFGVLHSIAVSVILLPYFLPLREWNIAIGLGILVLGGIIETPTVETSFLLPLGLMPPGFTSLDYVPLFPNLGTILLGAGLGHLFYVRGLRSLTWQSPPWLQIISIPGKFALAFYVVHQPIILFLLILLFGIPDVFR